MTANVRDLPTQALGLPERSRAMLADLLLDGLDEGMARPAMDSPRILRVALSLDSNQTGNPR